MKRFVALLVLLFLTLQASWAAVAPYCRHESGAATVHLGHHEHQHHADTGAAPAADPGDASGTAGFDDLDCHSCHAAHTPGLLARAPGWIGAPGAPQPLALSPAWPQPPSERPERPRWLLSSQ